MKYKLRAPFQTGSAAGCPVKEGICCVDTPEQVADLCKPPHGFCFLGEVSEVSEEPAEDETEAGPAAEADEPDPDSSEAETPVEPIDRPKNRKRNR